MRCIKKGCKAGYDGFILTKTEYTEYIKLLDLFKTLKSYKEDYDKSYSYDINKTFI